MVSFIPLFIAAVLATAYGQTALNVSSDAQDYMHISQRELLHEIAIAEFQITSVNDRFADRLDVIKSQQEQLLHEIQTVNKTLMPLQALGVVRKHCIQTYDGRLVQYDSAKLKMDTCYKKAESTGSSLTTTATTNVAYARSQAVNTLPQSAATCDRTYPKNQTQLQQCYIDAVERVTLSVNSYLTYAQTQLDLALYNAGIASNTAVQCSFAVEKDTLEDIGETFKIIDDCEVYYNKINVATAAATLGDRKSIKNLIMGTTN